jgi:hypothetical protein
MCEDIILGHHLPRDVHNTEIELRGSVSLFSGYDPEPGMVMTGVADVPQIREVIKVIDGLLTWLSQATREVEDQYFRTLKPDVGK